MSVVIEHEFVHNGTTRYADVAVVSSSHKIEVILEIYHTSLTVATRRPEPWFELNAQDVIDSFSATDPTMNLKCIRKTFVEGELYYSTCGECNETIICSDKAKGKIYFNQRGAGCGKAFSSCTCLIFRQLLRWT
jgi:hypothetical protein